MMLYVYHILYHHEPYVFIYIYITIYTIIYPIFTPNGGRSPGCEHWWTSRNSWGYQGAN